VAFHGVFGAAFKITVLPVARDGPSLLIETRRDSSTGRWRPRTPTASLATLRQLRTPKGVAFRQVALPGEFFDEIRRPLQSRRTRGRRAAGRKSRGRGPPPRLPIRPGAAPLPLEGCLQLQNAALASSLSVDHVVSSNARRGGRNGLFHVIVPRHQRLAEYLFGSRLMLSEHFARLRLDELAGRSKSAALRFEELRSHSSSLVASSRLYAER